MTSEYNGIESISVIMGKTHISVSKMPVSCLNRSVKDKKTDYMLNHVSLVLPLPVQYSILKQCNKGLLCMATVYPHLMLITGTKSCWH